MEFRTNSSILGLLEWTISLSPCNTILIFWQSIHVLGWFHYSCTAEGCPQTQPTTVWYQRVQKETQWQLACCRGRIMLIIEQMSCREESCAMYTVQYAKLFLSNSSLVSLYVATCMYRTVCSKLLNQQILWLLLVLYQ